MHKPLANLFSKLPNRQILTLLPLALVLAFLIAHTLLSIRAAMSGVSSGDNGFDLSNTAIPRGQILHGGPPRDGIPALTRPKFISAGEAGFLTPDSRILGVSIAGRSKAYPIDILNHHEIVNDTLAGKDITVTFCPLCGTGIVFDAKMDGEILEFGVSGLLYNSDVLLYDRQSESLWSQIPGKAISGPMSGKKLTRIPARYTSWQHWLKQHPETMVLSQQTGYLRNYRQPPYSGYNQSSAIYFPVSHRDRRYHSKEVVLAVTINGKNKAYPFKELAAYQKATGKKLLYDNLAGERISIQFDLASRSGLAVSQTGTEIASFQAFWFAWFAFYPDGEVFTAN